MSNNNDDNNNFCLVLLEIKILRNISTSFYTVLGFDNFCSAQIKLKIQVGTYKHN